MIHGIIFCLLNTNIDKHDKELTASVFLGLSPFSKNLQQCWLWICAILSVNCHNIPQLGIGYQYYDYAQRSKVCNSSNST